MPISYGLPEDDPDWADVAITEIEKRLSAAAQLGITDNNEPARLAQALLLARHTGDQAVERAAIEKLRERGDEPTSRRTDYRFRDAVADWAKRYSIATGSTST